MDTEDTDKFKIRLDDEDPDALKLDELKNDKIEKVNQKVTLIAILLPCLMILLGVAGYLEMKRNLANNMDASTTAVSDMYKEIDGQIGNMGTSVQSLNEVVVSDNQKLEAALKDIERLKSHVSDFESTTVGKEEQEKALGEISRQIKPINERVEGLKKDIQATKEDISKNLNGLTARLDELSSNASAQDKALKNIQSKLSLLDKNKIDAKTFQSTLKNEIDQLTLKNSQLKKDIDKIRIELIKIQNSNANGSNTGGNATGVIEETIE